MNTLYLKADNAADIKKAAEIIRNGGTVAFPTETVYGLGANALDAKAAVKIFEAKGRPVDNPLIVHVASFDEVKALVKEVDERFAALAKKFWPGPLTVISPKSDLVPDEVSGGLDTVGIRLPAHEAARQLIEEAGVPIAAPSANASGKPSPTAAEHVAEDMNGRINAILDGGRSDVGVESTIITLATKPPMLLRPGGITPEQLEEVLGEIQISHAVFEQLEEGERVQSPGMKYKHYSPQAQVTIIKGSFEQYKKFIFAQKDEVCAVCFEGEGVNFRKFVEYGKENDSLSQARGFFDALRAVDSLGCKRAFVRCPESKGVGLAVYNRLLRSAAFREIDLDFRIPVIGLTGQTGAGKSTVARLLKEEGFFIIDTDILARKAVESREVTALLCREFGDDIMAGGVLDRRELARRAFATPEGGEALNLITHPEITRLAVEEIHLAERNGARAAVIDAALLFESCLEAFCETKVSVIADEEIRLNRIIKRDSISREDAVLRISAQKSEQYYIGKSDIVISNNSAQMPEITSITEKY